MDNRFKRVGGFLPPQQNVSQQFPSTNSKQHTISREILSSSLSESNINKHTTSQMPFVPTKKQFLEEEKNEVCTSPTAWICDLGAVNKSSYFNKKVPLSEANLYEQKGGLGNQQQQLQTRRLTRNSVVKNIFSAESDDDDDEYQAAPARRDFQQISNSYEANQQSNNPPPKFAPFTPNSRQQDFTSKDYINVPIVNLNSSSGVGTAQQNSTAPNTRTSLSHTSIAESRIVAPNVSKLSPNSAVEIRLQSLDECVAVLCSVDVLKMRSGFFHDVLSEQEKARPFKSVTNANGVGYSNGSASANSHSQRSGSMSGMNSESLLWREAITVPETSPFEAAAYLESLHEGRALFRGEWNYCWAKLSVSWIIEDLILEYSSQIETHMARILTAIQSNHWRTAPNVLAGMRVAVFRKGTNAVPTVVTGMAIESQANIGYSKLRVAFDASDKTTSNTSAKHSTYTMPPTNSYAQPYRAVNNKYAQQLEGLSSPAVLPKDTPRERSNSVGMPYLSNVVANTGTAGNNGTNNNHAGGSNNVSAASSVNNMSQVDNNTPTPVIGDIPEPFWVQHVREGSSWTDPDDLFLIDGGKRYVTATDKRVFWEMARAILELPELTAHCISGIRNSADLAAVLKRPENRVLWTAEAPEYIPKDVATELIKSAYVLPSSGVSSGDK